MRCQCTKRCHARVLHPELGARYAQGHAPRSHTKSVYRKTSLAQKRRVHLGIHKGPRLMGRDNPSTRPSVKKKRAAALGVPR